MNFNHLPPLLQTAIRSALREKNIPTPFILCSQEQLNYNIDFFLDHIPADKIVFPVKVNHDGAVLNCIAQQGLSFEIASLGEMELLQKNKLVTGDVLFSNPVRIPSHTKAAHDAGIRIFAVDRISELKRLAEFAPGSKVYIRLDVINLGAAWQLDDKFGASANEALKLMKEAKTLGLQPYGLSFHVGWCNENLTAWALAVHQTIDVAKKAVKKGYSIDFINIGGGFPAHQVEQYSALEKISDTISHSLIEAFEKFGILIWAEPGSFIAANSSVLVTKVIDTTRRKRNNWAYIDAGLFQGFYWKMGGLNYNIISARMSSNRNKNFLITGPTCDSQDVFGFSVLLPSDLKEGDHLLVFPAGAYIDSAREYNGIHYPDTYLF